jgi:hypothetical protein
MTRPFFEVNMKKVIYFSAGYDLTDDEVAEVAALNAIAAPAFEVNVSNGAVLSGLETVLEECDYVAGTAPEAYAEVDTFDIENPPRLETVPATQAVVYDTQELTIGESTYTFTVEDGAVTGIAVA